MSTAIDEIKPVSLADIAKYSGKFVDEIKNLFISKIPEKYNDKTKFAGMDMEPFVRELLKRTLDQIPLTLESLAPLQLSQPTKFHWEFVKQLLSASETIKRQVVVEKCYETYNVEEDINETRQQIERMLSNEFKTEVKLWKLMDEKRWDEALTVLRAIEVEREEAELLYRAEVVNWKQQIAINSGDTNLFFESLGHIIDATKKDEILMYNPEDARMAINAFLHKEVEAIKFLFTPLAHQKAAHDASGNNFLKTQGEQFQEYLVKKIITAIFKDRTIKSGDDFRKFLTEKKIPITRAYTELNIYVDAIDW